MKKLLLFAAAAAALASCAPKTAPELPMETFFRNSEKTGYQISPDGRYFSYMAPYESRRNIFAVVFWGHSKGSQHRRADAEYIRPETNPIQVAFKMEEVL